MVDRFFSGHAIVQEIPGVGLEMRFAYRNPDTDLLLHQLGFRLKAFRDLPEASIDIETIIPNRDTEAIAEAN